MDRYPYILGCLLGTALGDAVGLRREGLSRGRAVKLYGEAPLKPDLIFGHGYCSDDTEHTQMVGRALTLSGGNADKFEVALARQLKCWLLTMPSGVGWATLRACTRLLVGFSPHRSGVFSAGNGPVMRAALIGVWSETDSQLVDLIRRSTRLTHTDPKAEQGALLVARAAGLRAHGNSLTPVEFLKQAATETEGAELQCRITAAVESLTRAQSPQEFAASQGWANGVSGYVNHTVPAALYCWASSPIDFRRCVESAVLLGGDTDSVAAIAGAVCGANLGNPNLPDDWLSALREWPRTVQWIKQLAKALSDSRAEAQREAVPSMRWLATIPRNIAFAALVLGIGFRRLLPPY